MTYACMIGTMESLIPFNGLQAWYDAATTPLGAVASWADRSGKGNSATQGTGGLQPINTAGQKNGLPCLLFNGSNLVLPAALYPLPNGGNSIFCVSARTSETGASDFLFNFSTGSGGLDNFLAYDNAAGQVDYRNFNAGGTQATINGLTNTNFQILMGSFNGTTAETVASNNGIAGTNTGSAVATIDRAWIGARTNGGTSHIGPIGEIIMYNRLLSSAETILVNRYLSAKWAITIS